MKKESNLAAWFGRSRAVGLCVVTAAVALASCGEDDAPGMSEATTDTDRLVLTPEQVLAADVSTQTVHLVSVAETHEVPAMLASPDTASATLGSVVEGRVAEVWVLPGDAVRAGQALLSIHSHELTEALRDLRGAEARLEYAAAAAERSSALLEAGAVSREEVERRTAERTQVEAEVERASEWVEHLSPSADGMVVVRAPREGVVFSVSVSSGAAVLPGAELVSLGRTDILWATGWVPERSSLVVRPGDSLDIDVPAAAGQSLRARVVQVGAVVDPARRAVAIRAELTEVPEGVRPGVFATLALPSGPEEARAILPEASVQRSGDREVAFVEEGAGIYRPVYVSTVVLPGGRVGVSGLEEGQRVVVTGAYALVSVLAGNRPAGGGS